MKRLLFFLALVSGRLSAQITPPGLGNTHLASWEAIALKYDFDTRNKSGITTYFGIGRISRPDDFNPVEQASISVWSAAFSQDIFRKYTYTLGLSYRRQHMYDSDYPYAESYPSIRQEFRFSAGIARAIKWKKSRFSTGFQQEFRKFYTPSFDSWEETLELRTRLRLKYSYLFRENKRHKLTVSAELLFSASKQQFPVERWEEFMYRDSRFCLFYSYTPGKGVCTLEAGYMNNLIGSTHPSDVHYIAFNALLNLDKILRPLPRS